MKTLPELAIQRSEREPGRIGSLASMRADWNDVHAGVGVGAEQAEWAVIRRTTGSGGDEHPEARFELRSNIGDRATIIARRTGDALENTPIELWCSVGLFGDPARETRLLGLIARRLEQLRGVEFAPVD